MVLQTDTPGLGLPGSQAWALFWWSRPRVLFCTEFGPGTLVTLEVGIDGGVEESRPTSCPWRLLKAGRAWVPSCPLRERAW